jgi:hypothetical protein
MSNCCFPKLSCMKLKNRVRNTSENSISQGIKLNSSVSRPAKVIIASSSHESFSLNKSIAEAQKSSNLSRFSHKSVIAIKQRERFEPQKAKFLSEKLDQVNSSSISKISENFITDKSYVDFFGDIKLKEKIDVPRTKIPNVLKRNIIYHRSQFGSNRKEIPMFVKNPCFGDSSVSDHPPASPKAQAE